MLPSSEKTIIKLSPDLNLILFKSDVFRNQSWNIFSEFLRFVYLLSCSGEIATEEGVLN